MSERPVLDLTFEYPHVHLQTSSPEITVTVATKLLTRNHEILRMNTHPFNSTIHILHPHPHPILCVHTHTNHNNKKLTQTQSPASLSQK